MANSVELATAYVSLVGDTRKLVKDINSAFDGYDGRPAGRKIVASVSQGMTGGNSAIARAGADAAAVYERNLQASIRGERIGTAIGTVIGKGIGAGITVGIGAAATAATAAVAGIGLALTKGFTRLKNIDQATFKLKALGNSAEDVKQIMDSALESVKGTSFGLDEGANTAASAVAAGVGKNDLTGYLKNVADAAAIAGTSMDDMGSIFNKVQTNGKAMTDDLQMLADRQIPIFVWLQKQYGVTGEALQKMVEDGKVSSADLGRAIHDNIEGAAKNMGGSFDGAINNINSALGRLGATFINGALGGTGLSGPTAALGELTRSLDQVDGWVKAHSSSITDFFAGMGQAAIRGTKDVLQAVAELIGAFGGLQDFIGNILGGMNKFQAWQADFRGDHDVANDLRAQAEEFFSWGNSAKAAQQKIMDLVNGLDKPSQQLDQWAQNAKKAQTVTAALGDAFVKVADNGDVIIDSNAPDVMQNLNDLGLVIKDLPDGKFNVVAGTPEAQAALDAFLQKNGVLPPAKLPVDVDITAATAKLQGLYTEIFKAPNGYVPPLAPVGNNNPVLAGPNAGGFVPYDPSAWIPGMNNGRRIPGRAGGGDISGPGPKGRDSVLMYGAPGEHMLTASDVDKMGGQAGVYAFRSALQSGRIPGFDQGGAIPGGGGAISAIDYAYGAQGTPYQYGSFDCSMFASQIYAQMAGLPPGRYFTTETDFAALGFKPGFKPGALNIGIRRGGGGPNSHMAVTLPNGVSAENTGSGAMYGGNAHGADTFPLQYYYEPPNSGDMGQMQLAGAQQSAVDPNTTTHGMGMGALPGPQNVGGTAGVGAQGPGGQIRTEGYIPAAAGNTSVAGTSFLSGLYGMGAEAINGVIDQAASAASTAVAAGVTAGTFGAGAAGGGQAAASAAQFAIGLGTQAAKRGVQYGAQMLGIGTDALIEQLTPFGAPRLLTTDPTGFMPQQLISGAISQGIKGAFNPQQGQPGEPGSPVPGAPAAPTAPPAPGVTPAAQQTTPPLPASPQPQTNPLTDPLKLLNGGVYDSGGWLPPGGVAVNLGNKPEPVLSPSQWSEMAASAASPAQSGAVYNIYPKDANEAIRALRNKERLDMMTHAGRP